MIIRVFEALVTRGCEGEFATLEVEMLDHARMVPELVSLATGRRTEDGRTRAVAVSIWDNADVLRSYLGGDIDRPGITPELSRLIDAWDLRQYETTIVSDTEAWSFGELP